MKCQFFVNNKQTNENNWKYEWITNALALKVVSWKCMIPEVVMCSRWYYYCNLKLEITGKIQLITITITISLNGTNYKLH